MVLEADIESNLVKEIVENTIDMLFYSIQSYIHFMRYLLIGISLGH